VRGAEPAKASDSIQGVRIGAEIEEVEKTLERYGPALRAGSEGEDEHEGDEKRRGVWSLARGDYETIVVEADTQGRVTGATGFVRKGREIPFERFGGQSAAARWTESIAIWNVPTPEGGYRLIARGPDRRARVVTLISLAAPRME
jgi:hypothetical protein